MTRVHVICEGQTEEMFVKEILSDIFVAGNIQLIPALIGKPGHKGGQVTFDRLYFDVRSRLMGDPTSYCTTFLDFYGLPSDFPGKLDARHNLSSYEKSECIIQAVNKELFARLGEDSMQRFIPYVQMHEFEGLLFSDPDSLAKGIGQANLGDELQAIRSQFDSPEDINDHYETAPSKRLLGLYDGYDKPVHGSLAALEIGVDVIRKECPLFDSWLQEIASLH